MNQKDLLQRISSDAQFILVTTAEIEAYKRLFEASILKGDKIKADEYRFKIHNTLDILLDHQSSVSTLTAILMNPNDR